MTKVVTFYSYKGGVGRTMALVNVAHVLARDGWRVLMVDFDLEAPGMTHFFAEAVRNRPETVRYDALDLLLRAKRSLFDSDANGGKREPPNSLAEFVINVEMPEKWLEKGESGIPYRNGRLDLLPATLKPREVEPAPEEEPTYDYLRRMDELDLTSVFSSDGPGHRFGDHVRQYFLHARFRAPGDVLFAMREEVIAAYDMVLVDSRTGLNEISGLCIGPLCDALVICVGLNHQNIYGTRYFMQKAGLLESEKAKPYLVAAGPIPPWHTRRAKTPVKLLKKELHAENVIAIPYHPAAAIRETVFVLNEPEEPISKAYVELASELGSQARDTYVPGLKRRITTALDEGCTSLAMLNRELATCLSVSRISRRRFKRFRPVSLFASLPSAFTLGSLPRTGHGESLEMVDAERLSLGAAVAAYRLQSDAPLKRAIKLLGRFQSKGGGPGRDLALRLMFFQSRLRVSPSPGFLEVSSERKMLLGRHDLEKVLRRPRNDSLTLVDWLVVLLQAGDGAPLHATVDPQKEIEQLLVHQPHKQFRLRGPRRFPHYVQVSYRDFSEKLSPSLIISMLKPLTPENRDSIASVANSTPLPSPPKELLAPNGDDFRTSFHPEMIEEMLIDRERFRDPVPLGFWPEPLLAAATALLKGPDAVDDVLAWIRLSRLFYGYAWRVLVDWRFLESVKDHPSFVKFLSEEDEMVDEIESAFDRGEFTL